MGRMKPQVINGEKLSWWQDKAVWEWAQRNGVRHYIPRHAKIVVTGNYLITDTLDIGRVDHRGKLRWNYFGDPLPIKRRKYRIRYPLNLSK